MNDPNKLSIEARHLSKEITSGSSKLTILKDLDLSIYDGEAVVITGVSGSGKSTLLHLLAGLDIPTSGTIKLFQEDLASLNENQRTLLRQKNIGFVFQSFYLLPTLTVLENVMLPLELQGIPEPQSKAIEMLKETKLEDRQHHYPNQLSGGEQQRTAIARAYVTDPKILFADEPTGNLDPITSEIVLEHMFTMNQKKQATLVIVTHDASLAKRCKTHYALENGQLASRGSSYE